MMADWLAACVRDRVPVEGSRYRYVKSSGAIEERALE
jgi:hypothetical protein